MSFTDLPVIPTPTPSGTDPYGDNMAARLFEQLQPFQTLGNALHLWALCDGIGAMFEQIEQLTADRDDGLAGYANLLDIDTITIDRIGYLAQYVGVNLKSGLSDADQRDWVRAMDGFARGRPDTIKATVATTLTGNKTVQLRERVPTAWRYTVVTKPSETPNPSMTDQVIQEQKPGPDIATHLMVESPTYEWVKDTYATYGDLRAAYATYGDLTNAVIT